MTIATGQPMLASDILNLTFFPKGTILTFSSEAWNNATYPGFKDIWKVCNKTNHVANPNIPDLTDKFLRGAESSDFTTARGADSQNITLTSTHLPSHTHGTTSLSLSGLSTSGLIIGSDGVHTHTLSGGTSESGSHKHDLSDGKAASDGAHTHTYEKSFKVAPSDTDNYGGMSNLKYETTDTSTSGSHTHSVSGTISTIGTHTHDFSSTSSAAAAGTHNHTISGSITGSIAGSIDSTGDGQAFSVNTVPSYYTVIYIMKTA
ncbi:MAG: hypothetical protein LBJ25_02690 [Candidatus Margulisbacteria bacterium]|jgi:hypothetical protein|nr:hypothetical protein [Candidatus Margulisiibacteriota bacterium]